MKIDEIMKMRKRQSKIVASINKLNNEFDNISSELKAIESNCDHLWSSREYISDKDLFKRTCQKCGKDDYRKN